MKLCIGKFRIISQEPLFYTLKDLLRFLAIAPFLIAVRRFLYKIILPMTTESNTAAPVGATMVSMGEDDVSIKIKYIL